MRYLLVFFIVLIMSACGARGVVASGDALPPKFEIGQAYGSVRDELIKQGWIPVVSPSADVCMEGDVRCVNRPEMEACSGVESAPCKFVWKKNNSIISVFTVGSDATDEGDAAFDSLEMINLNVQNK